MSTAKSKVSELTSSSNQDWQARKDDAIARGEGNIAPVYVERALGSEIWDVEGKRYIDFGTGIAVCSAGHSHPKIVAAVAEQLERFSHTCVMVTPYDSAVRLAEKLNELAPGTSKKKSIFVT
ncbi:MAG: aminotransferase class III-fold pyridoxal phosphate-dependent enzyme, partial [Gammaproteobacteria bacterium]|nr:aminotransferase class III-fold pyridoxal phosphate-dependent enzyme [Gammaproteobacteria bacterium]